MQAAGGGRLMPVGEGALLPGQNFFCLQFCYHRGRNMVYNEPEWTDMAEDA
ncbi:hypothetical protein HMPREF0262_03658 [Clostridium sp. ATCC 29733]|nr:hypothetical protein HMPREF0262_03658 [Clostridium sp. ATCC 29733]